MDDFAELFIGSGHEGRESFLIPEVKVDVAVVQQRLHHGNALNRAGGV